MCIENIMNNNGKNNNKNALSGNKQERNRKSQRENERSQTSETPPFNVCSIPITVGLGSTLMSDVVKTVHMVLLSFSVMTQKKTKTKINNVA